MCLPCVEFIGGGQKEIESFFLEQIFTLWNFETHMLARSMVSRRFPRNCTSGYLWSLWSLTCNYTCFHSLSSLCTALTEMDLLAVDTESVEEWCLRSPPRHRERLWWKYKIPTTCHYAFWEIGNQALINENPPHHLCPTSPLHTSENTQTWSQKKCHFLWFQNLVISCIRWHFLCHRDCSQVSQKRKKKKTSVLSQYDKEKQIALKHESSVLNYSPLLSSNKQTNKTKEAVFS